MVYYVLEYFVGDMQYSHGIYPESVILTDIVIYVHYICILNFLKTLVCTATPPLLHVFNVFYIILLLMMRESYFFQLEGYTLEFCKMYVHTANADTIPKSE